MKKLLLIVDPQIDFITGTLPVAGAAEAMDALAKYVKEKGNEIYREDCYSRLASLSS